ncbi:MAG: FAD-dependent oxidoreductase, partial [Firmicutes bacterium]|nr:FAD-dependent oxidoreductase [Bacillota bacterium]
MQIVRIHEIKIRAEEGKGLQQEALEALLLKKLERRLRLPGGSIRQIRIAKESLDAREKPDVYRVFSLDVTDSEFAPEELLAEARRSHCKAAVLEETAVSFPEKRVLPKDAKRPVVAGFGPCGIFAALTLAKAGLRPIVLERGACMEERVAAVERFWSEGVLDPRTNVQFGEGGAGSFSDGKLTTGTKDPVHRLILQCFVDAGADPDILYRQHPHVGTDVLRGVVVNLRKQIEALGGEVRFRTQLTGLTIEEGKLTAVEAAGPEGTTERIVTDALILGLGHSARDSFAMLHGLGLWMEQKPFSMGVRIEHRQADIDKAQYAALHEELGIGAAEYKLSVRTEAGRGVYTFCMCPGGQVVASASEEGGLCTNGMSLRARDGENANSGLL